jgi:C-terminal processing protease CtpA/Prc
MIIDVRPNNGGSEPFAMEIAGCFTQQSAVYAKHIYRDKNSPTGWGQVRERTLKPNVDMPTYKGKVAVLVGQANFSSCESFIMMMKQTTDCKIIGEKTYGSSGNPKEYDLGNGVEVWLPSWKDLDLGEKCLEGVGIKPDITVRTMESQLRINDIVLESALKYLKSNS